MEKVPHLLISQFIFLEIKKLSSSRWQLKVFSNPNFCLKAQISLLAPPNIVFLIWESHFIHFVWKSPAKWAQPASFLKFTVNLLDLSTLLMSQTRELKGGWRGAFPELPLSQSTCHFIYSLWNPELFQTYNFSEGKPPNLRPISESQ